MSKVAPVARRENGLAALGIRRGALLLCVLLAACETVPPPVAPPPEPPPIAPPPPEPPPPPPPPPPEPKPAVPTAEAQERARRIAADAFRLLLDGNEARARPLLNEAVVLDPSPGSQGACLLRGVTADLIETLGRASTPYRVGPGETIVSIARRVFGDGCAFYLLARYNNLKTPRSLATNQILRIPGTATLRPPPAPPPGPRPPTEDPAEVQPPEPTSPPPPPPRPTPPDRSAIDRTYRDGVEAFRAQKLGEARAAFLQVLEMDPNYPNVQAYLRKIADLERRTGTPR